MSTLTLIRHGQARFGTDNYDALSALGVQQCEALREYWRSRGEAFDEVWSGSMRRQVHSAELALSDPEVDARWNEYDADAILHQLAPRLAERSNTFSPLWKAHQSAPADPKGFQKMFEVLMPAWVSGDLEHPDVESWQTVCDRVRAALRQIVERPGSRRVAVFTSGGPIGIAVITALGAPERKALELNWRLRNGSMTNFLFSGGRVSLDGFNLTPHLTPEAESFR